MRSSDSAGHPLQRASQTPQTGDAAGSLEISAQPLVHDLKTCALVGTSSGDVSNEHADLGFLEAAQAAECQSLVDQCGSQTAPSMLRSRGHIFDCPQVVVSLKRTGEEIGRARPHCAD